MIDIKQFANLEKNSKNSFAQQKQMMKKLMAGQTVPCPKCQQPRFLFTPESGNTAGIRCQKGCTDIQLDFV